MQKQQTDILFLSHRYEVTSGGEKALLDMIKHLVSIGIRPHVIIGSTGSIIDHLEELDVPYSIIYLPFWAHSGNDPTPFEFTSLNPTVNTTLQIVKLIKELKPKLCATNTMVMPWLGYAASITGVPHAWMIHELGTAGFNFRYAIGEEQTLRNIDNLSDIIFYNSKHTSKYYLPHFAYNKGAPVIYPAGDPPVVNKDVSSPYKHDGLKLACVGQIKEQKGQLDAVKAINELKKEGVEAELVIIGGTEEKDYYDKITAYISDHSLNDRVQLLGHHDNPSSLVSYADIAINCATNESFGRVTVEAMLLGKAVIGANSAGTAEILDSEQHGLLYTPGNHKDLAKVIKFLQDHPGEMHAMGSKASTVATERYSANKRYLSFIDYYKDIPKKTALDLSILDSVTSDFQSSLALLERDSNELNSIKNSKAWRVLFKLKSAALKR